MKTLSQRVDCNPMRIYLCRKNTTQRHSISNLTYIVGIFLSLGIWSIPEGFGGPYIPGATTDIGTAFPYAILFVVLLFLSAGRYYGLDQWLTSKLGRLGFLASGSIRLIRKSYGRS